MPACQIPYIPDRLHQNDRAVVTTFEVGEHLYMRCKPEVVENPYAGISLTELSHNRSGLSDKILCNPDDVLYSIKADEPFEMYGDKLVCILEIKSLTEDHQYQKSYSASKNGIEYTSELCLLHEPEPCMYPHCVFRITLNGDTVTYDNYKETLGRVHKIRNEIREELASMIVRRQVHQNDNPF